MEQVTLRLPTRLKAELEREADERGVSRSEHIRDVLGRREEVRELRDRLDRRERRIDDLEEQLRRRSQVEEKVDTLAKRVEDDDAPFFVRWWRWYRERDGGE
jgi:metal-responsive CopG/Arc/MetJ family transcriptional regulator